MGAGRTGNGKWSSGRRWSGRLERGKVDRNMSFQLKHQHVDEYLGRHYIVLHDPDTGAEHHIALYTGHKTCPTCGHVKPIDNLGNIDHKALIREEIKALEASKAQTRAHAKKHGIPTLKADGKAR
jgi:hypothetical protein